MNPIIDIITKNLPFGRKVSPKGWYTFNGVCCVAAGEHRADTRQRAGILFTADGGLRYNCFNCGTSASWSPGLLINKKMEFVLRQMKVNQDDIRKIKFKAWQMRGQIELKIIDHKPHWQKLSFNAAALPEGTKSFQEWVVLDEPPEGFLKAVEYIQSRGDCFLTAHRYFWSPVRGFYNRIIIPFYWKSQLVGWSSRLFQGSGSRYYGNIPSDYLFNNQVIHQDDREIIIITEGIFDAIGIDGVGVLGNELSKVQIQWINSGGKKVIIVPDRNKAGQKLIDTAIKERWNVSFPMWEQDIIDVADAIKRYGRIYTLKSIIESQESNRVSINVKRKKFGLKTK